MTLSVSPSTVTCVPTAIDWDRRKVRVVPSSMRTLTLKWVSLRETQEERGIRWPTAPSTVMAVFPLPLPN